MTTKIHNHSCVSSDEQELPQADLASLLSLAGDAVDTLVLRALADAGLHGLRPGHGYVVQRLLTGPATASEMATVLGVSQQAVSKTVRELLELGYLAEVPAVDRRRRPVALAESGRRAVEVARAARAGFEASLREDVGARAADAAEAVLRAALEYLHRAGAVRTRSVPPPPESS
jgi:DNA-binding MarR family transcriptional regulator